MRGALARFLFVVLACRPGAGAGSDLIVATAAAVSSGDWQISAKVDDVAKTKVLNVKVEARKTTHDGLFLLSSALLHLVCLKDKPLIHVMFAFQIGSKADLKFSIASMRDPCCGSSRASWRGLKIFVIEKKTEVKQFLDGLATANAPHIQISSLDKGSTSARASRGRRATRDRRALRLLQARLQEDVREVVVRYSALARSQLRC